MATSRLTPNFVKNLEYTNNFIPDSKMDSTAKIIVKWISIIFTLGLIFIGPLIVDISKISYQKLFNRSNVSIVENNPSVAVDQTNTINDLPSTQTANITLVTTPPLVTSTSPVRQPLSPEVTSPARQPLSPNSSAKRVLFPTSPQRNNVSEVINLNDALTKENSIKVLQTIPQGLIIGPQKVSEFLVNPNKDLYQKIGYAFGDTIRYCIAASFYRGSITGGILSGIVVSILFNGTGVGLRLLDDYGRTAPANS